MASMSVLSLPHLISLALLFSLTVAGQQPAALIHETCKASRDPPACQTWLSGDSAHLPQNATVLDVIRSALSLTSGNLRKGRDMVQAILRASGGNLNRTNAANTCLEELGFADYRVSLVGGAVPSGEKLKDARAWIGASLVYMYDCWSALKYVNDTSLVRDAMVFFNDTLIAGASNALAMVANYELFRDGAGSWGPVRTERDGFWGTGSEYSSGSPVGPLGGGVPRGLKPDVTVCKGGQCGYATVQDAINGAPDNDGSGKKHVIWVKAGVYDEVVRVPLEKRNVVLLGDGMGKTVITGSKNVGQPGVTTYNTATFGVAGDGFMAKDLTIQNTAGPDAHQAVAFRSDSDRSVIENCEFIGNQDTLYAHSLRQYYKSCRIQGNVDFIFGFSTSFFQDCTILVAPRQVNPEKGENNAVTAHGRTDPAQSTGFVFQNCLINGTEAYMSLYYKNPKVHRNYLGRPWKEYSRTVFINSTLEVIISPEGWLPWDKDFALKTLYYGEYGNNGKGADTSKRVAWSNQIPAEHVGVYSVQNFIQGDQWIPSCEKMNDRAILL